jgi:hypothetical protein
VGANCTFRVSGRRPELWDPLTGRISRPALYQERNGRVSLPLWLGPAGSVFVVFREASRSAAVASFSRDGRSLLPQAGRPLAEAPAAGLREVEPNTFALLARQPGRYELKTAGGRRLTASVPALPAPLAVNGPWEVRFQRGRGAPERLSLDALVDWAKHPDPAVRYFSGTATYTCSFRVPAALLAPGRRLTLDLGDVQVMAGVRLNGKDLGILWKAPFRVDATAALQPGENRLEVTVANLWPNRLIGDQAGPREARVTWTTWNPFRPTDALLPSGLIGPVRLEAAQQVVLRASASVGQ